MKICTKCLNCYGHGNWKYCPIDGKRLVDSANKQAKPLIERIRKELIWEGTKNG